MPDVTGQPWWVVVIVAVLGVLGGVGADLLRRRAKHVPTDEESPEALPSGEGGEAYQAVKLAIQALAETAAREAAESTEERARATDLRHQLEECARALQLAEENNRETQRRLMQCEDNARALIQKFPGGS